MSVVLGLEDGSDGDVETDCDRTAGREKTDRTSSVQCEPVAKSVLVRQQGDATRVGQPNPAEVAEDELVSKARFCCSRQLVVPFLEAREHRVSQIAHREVERVRCRGTVDCDGCSEAQDGAETRLHREGCQECIRCRESIRQAIPRDDMGQRRLQDAPQCRVTTGRLVLKALRVERVQEDQDAEMTATHASRMAGCRLHPMEKSSWKEDVSVSLRRGTEKVGSPKYELLEMVVILMSLSVVPKVAELSCEDRFGDAAVGNVTGATGWDKEEEKQMKEVKRRVMDEEHGRTFDKLMEMIWITSKMNEVKHRYLWGRVRRYCERGKDEMFKDEMFNATLDMP